MKRRQRGKLAEQIGWKPDFISTDARLRENMRGIERGKDKLLSTQERLIAKRLRTLEDSRSILWVVRVVVVLVDRSDDPGGLDHRSANLARFIDEGAVPACASNRKRSELFPQSTTVDEKIHSPVRRLDSTMLTSISTQLGFPRGRLEVPIVRKLHIPAPSYH